MNVTTGGKCPLSCACEDHGADFRVIFNPVQKVQKAVVGLVVQCVEFLRAV
ncbi:hypothetical protein PsAD37_03228 [Pseudovibrio sp. Ad37]|nr:hypothetical protein PsAD37_03228 [Pseudovibrio sp. Ad37]